MVKRIFICFWFSLLLLSCKKENAFDCFTPNGDVISEFRTPGAFSEIEMNDNIEVTVFKGTAYKVEVIAGKNIIRKISTKVNNGVLKIENENRCNFVRGYKKKIHINITVPRIHSILNNGVANLNLDEGFSQDTIYIKAESSGDIHIHGAYTCINASSNGNADIYLNGKCSSLYVYTNGTNYIKAEDLIVSDYVFIETLSIGDCYVNARQLKKMEYNIWREGNIYYKGEPGIIRGYLDEASKGKVIRMDD